MHAKGELPPGEIGTRRRRGLVSSKRRGDHADWLGTVQLQADGEGAAGGEVEGDREGAAGGEDDAIWSMHRRRVEAWLLEVVAALHELDPGVLPPVDRLAVSERARA